MIDAEGGAPHRLTTGGFDEGPPEWSGDGKWLYFVSNRGDGLVPWKVAPGGGSPILLYRNYYTGGITEGVMSSEGKFDYYRRRDGSVWKAPTGGGSHVLLARNALARNGRPTLFESSDAKFLYYAGPNDSIWRAPVDGGQAAPVLKAGKRGFWTSSTNGIYLLDPDAEGGPTITLLPFNGEGTQVVRLPGQPDAYLESIAAPAFPLVERTGLAASRDGRWIVYSYRDRSDTELMLVENFR